MASSKPYASVSEDSSDVQVVDCNARVIDSKESLTHPDSEQTNSDRLVISMTQERVRNCMPSSIQVEKLVEMLESKPSLAMGHARTSFARARMSLAWQEIAETLNNMNGCFKSWVQWSKYWRDKKGAVKRKTGLRHIMENKTLDGQEDLPDLCPIEEKILSLMLSSRTATGDKLFDPPQANENTNITAPSISSGNGGSSEDIINYNITEQTPVLIEIVNTIPQPAAILSPSAQLHSEDSNRTSSPSPSINDDKATEKHPTLYPVNKEQNASETPPSRRKRRLHRGIQKPTPRFKINFAERLLALQERQITLEERRCENESHVIRILENIGQAWTNQSRSLVNVTEALNVLVEKINFK